MRFSWASRSNFSVFQSALAALLRVREVREHTHTDIQTNLRGCPTLGACIQWLKFSFWNFSLKTSLSVVPIFFSAHLTPKHLHEFFRVSKPSGLLLCSYCEYCGKFWNCAMRGSWASRWIFSDPAVQWWLVAVCVKSVRTDITISAPASCHQTADGGLVERGGGHVYRYRGLWEPFQAFGSLCGGFWHSGDASSDSNFHFGIFRSKRHFRSYRFFSAFTSPQSTPWIFFVFQNPAVCYFAHIASIAENFYGSVVYGSWASRWIFFSDPAVQWWLVAECVKSVHTDIQTNKYVPINVG